VHDREPPPKDHAGGEAHGDAVGRSAMGATAGPDVGSAVGGAVENAAIRSAVGCGAGKAVKKRNCRPRVDVSTWNMAASIGASVSDGRHNTRPQQVWGKRRVTITLASPLGWTRTDVAMEQRVNWNRMKRPSDVARAVRLNSRRSWVTLERAAATPATQNAPSVQLLLRVSTVNIARS